MDVEILGPVVKSYRVNRNISLDDLEKATKLKKEVLATYEVGESSAPVEHLELLAKVYKINWIAFIDSEPEPKKELGNDNRSLNNQREKLDLETIGVIDDTAYLLEVIAEAIPDKKFTLNDFNVSTTSPEKAGEALRHYLGIKLPDIPEAKDPYAVLRFWKDIFGSKGLYIFERRWEQKTIRAFSIARENKAAAVLRSSDVPFAKVFSLVHEVCHILNNDPGICDLHFGQGNDKEVMCNQFASAFLMPNKEFEQYAESMGLSTSKPDTVRERDIKELRNYFRTSRLSVYRRLLTLKFISKARYEAVQDEYEDYTRDESKSGGTYYKNRFNSVGKNYASDVLAAHANDKISTRTVARLFNVRVSQLQQIISMVGNSSGKK